VLQHIWCSQLKLKLQHCATTTAASNTDTRQRICAAGRSRIEETLTADSLQVCVPTCATALIQATALTTHRAFMLQRAAGVSTASRDRHVGSNWAHGRRSWERGERPASAVLPCTVAPTLCRLMLTLLTRQKYGFRAGVGWNIRSRGQGRRPRCLWLCDRRDCGPWRCAALCSLPRAAHGKCLRCCEGSRSYFRLRVTARSLSKDSGGWVELSQCAELCTLRVLRKKFTRWATQPCIT
jgi:hypothetical protein